MECKLRTLIMTKREASGLAVEQLAQVANCSITELRGYEQGLFMLGLDRLASLITALNVGFDELVAAVGETEAATLQSVSNDLASQG